MHQRPPGGNEPQPDAPGPDEAPRPQEPAALPWERTQTPLPEQPRSTIISADPVLTDEPSADAPVVAWAAPAAPRQERDVPGAPGFVFASTSRRFVALVLDNILLAIVSSVIAGIAAVALGIETRGTDSTTLSAVFGIVYVTVSFLYFVLIWTSRRPATPGMRAMKIQIGTAFEGRPLQFGPAVVRWALLGYPLSLANAVPAIFSVASLVGFVWYVVLLITTIASDTRQGIHDRVAGTAVVQPAGLGRSALVLTCLVLIIGWLAFWLFLFVVLLLGGQISSLQDASQTN